VTITHACVIGFRGPISQSRSQKRGVHRKRTYPAVFGSVGQCPYADRSRSTVSASHVRACVMGYGRCTSRAARVRFGV
jgi:hypothetical protein